MFFSSNKSLPAWFLLVVALENAWHMKGVWRYHRYERPKDRWDFKVFDIPTPIRISNPASLTRQHIENMKTVLFAEEATATQIIHQQQHPSNNQTKPIVDKTHSITSNRNIGKNINNTNTNSDKEDKPDAPYVRKHYLHQPFSKKNSPWKIFAHIICGTVPIFTGALQLFDFLRTNGDGKTTVSRSHRVLGYLFFVFGFLTSVQGMLLAPNMQFSHARTFLRTAVCLLGAATAVCIVFSIQFLRRAVRIPKDKPKRAVLRSSNIVGHKVWALRAWLLMEFFVLWARVLMGCSFFLTGRKYSFVIGSVASLVTVPFLLEWIVLCHLKRSGEGEAFVLLGPLPWSAAAKTIAEVSDRKKTD